MSLAQLGRAANRRDNAILVRRAMRVAHEAHTAAGADVEQAIELIDEAEEAVERQAFHKAMRLLRRSVECSVGCNPLNIYNRRVRGLQDHLAGRS